MKHVLMSEIARIIIIRLYNRWWLNCASPRTPQGERDQDTDAQVQCLLSSLPVAPRPDGKAPQPLNRDSVHGNSTIHPLIVTDEGDKRAKRTMFLSYFIAIKNL